MTRDQRFRHEMLVRVRMFGASHPEIFTPSSVCGRLLTEVQAAEASIDTHGAGHILAFTRTARMKAWPRAALFGAMKRIVRAARRVPWADPPHPFQLPRPRTIAGDLAAGRRFLEEGARHREALVRAGVSETFLSDLRVALERFQQAADMRVRGWRERTVAMAGVEAAFRRGLDAVRGLDVAMPFALEGDPVLLAAWQSARRISGLRKSTRGSKKPGGS